MKTIKDYFYKLDIFSLLETINSLEKNLNNNLIINKKEWENIYAFFVYYTIIKVFISKGAKTKLQSSDTKNFFKKIKKKYYFLFKDKEYLEFFNSIRKIDYIIKRRSTPFDTMILIPKNNKKHIEIILSFIKKRISKRSFLFFYFASITLYSFTLRDKKRSKCVNNYFSILRDLLIALEKNNYNFFNNESNLILSKKEKNRMKNNTEEDVR